ncbi:reverse transcriptase domain-containing protein [Tanacetum coccineum]
MDDEPMWAANRFVTPTPSSAITILETANEFSIKDHRFLGICDMFKYRDTENEVVRLIMFPLSLTGEAKTWLNELNERTIKTWDELRTTFINRFFTPALFDRLLGEIRAFSQHENETLTKAWLRMKEMLRNCHGHNLSKGNIIKNFYHGLNEITQEVLNAAAGGIFLYKTPNQAYQLLEYKVLLKLDWAKNQKFKPSLKKTVAFADEAQNKQVNAIFTWSGKSYDPPINPNDQPNKSETPVIFDSDDEDEEPTPQPKPKEKMEAQYGKFIDMIRAVRINVPLVDVLAGMPKYGKFLKELFHQNLETPEVSSFHVISKSFSCDALADHGASINLMPYSLYANLSLKTLKPTKISVRLADKSFQYPVGIDENMLVKGGKFTFPIDFVILEMEEDSKVPLILGRPFLYTADAIIQVKQKQLNLRVGTERMTFHMDSMMKHSYSKDDTCFSIDVIDEILEEDFDALLDEGSKILHSIEGTILEEKLFAEFDELIAMTAEENSESESNTEEPPFEKITFNTNYNVSLNFI